MKVLLVEPLYKVRYWPIPLQKIATYHLEKGDKVKFVRGMLIGKSFKPDLVYITSVFTFHGQVVIDTVNLYRKSFPDAEIKVGGIFASLMSKEVESMTGITPHIGQWELIDDYDYNWDLFSSKSSWQDMWVAVSTSKGCPRGCEFCFVKSTEKKFRVIPFKVWKNQIENSGKDHVSILDNNFNALPFSHQKEVVAYLKKSGLNVDLNGGLDVRLLKEKHIKLYKGVKFTMVRTAFDGMDQDGYFQESIKLAQKYGFKAKNIMSYCLYNFKDKPEDLWYRIKECLKLGVNVYPTKYYHVSMKTDYIGEHWNPQMLKGFKVLTRKFCTRTGMIGGYGGRRWKETITSSAAEFIDTINRLGGRTQNYDKVVRESKTFFE